MMKYFGHKGLVLGTVLCVLAWAGNAPAAGYEVRLPVEKTVRLAPPPEKSADAAAKSAKPAKPALDEKKAAPLAPKTEAPKAEAPKADAPKAVPPKAEAPKVEVPKAKAPPVAVAKPAPEPKPALAPKPKPILKVDPLALETPPASAPHEPIALPELINEVLSFLDKEAMFRSIEVQTFVAEDLPAIESDKGQLQQVFLNLINNAFQALKKDGRVGILIEDREPDHVMVTISDNGPGIDKEDLEHIFEPFFTTRSEGTGLGLAITYGIVRKLRGEITVESAVGQGTAFHVLLPRKRGD